MGGPSVLQQGSLGREYTSSNYQNYMYQQEEYHRGMLQQQAQGQAMEQALRNQQVAASIGAQTNNVSPYLTFQQGLNTGLVFTNPSATLKVEGDLEVNGKIIQKGGKMFGIYSSFKNYILKHGDVIFTAVLIIIADRYLFNGALKNTIQGLAEKLLGKAHAELDKKV